MATYEKGDKDEEVGQIQRKLGIPVTDVFDARTLTAVKAWQKENGEKPDGMIGPDMLLALGLPHLVLLENGDLGKLVEALQEALELEADGEFTDDTEKALRRYQKKNGLKATGSADIDLLQQLGAIDEQGEAHEGEDEDADQDEDDDHKDDGDDDDHDDDEDDDDHDSKEDRDDDDDDDRDEQRAKPTSRKAAQDTRGSATPPARGPLKAPPVSRSQPLPMPRADADADADAGGIPARHPIQSWAYQLADIDREAIAGLDVDLVVIDYSADGSADTAFTADDIAHMKERPSGGRKLVISYMSIGEAEDYRFYWQKSWSGKAAGKGRGKAKAQPQAQEAEKPAWLDDVNPDWEGNYKVRYWDPEWQAVIMGSPDAYLDRIIAAGFDGVYLDIIDAFEYWRDEKKERPSAAEDMIAFVIAISEYARARRPNFWIVPQNGEALLDDASYRAAISAQGKEDIFFGQDGDGRANSKGAVKDCLDSLAYAHADGIPVLAIEYLSDGKKIEKAAQQLSDAGCTAYFGPRDLDELRTNKVA